MSLKFTMRNHVLLSLVYATKKCPLQLILVTNELFSCVRQVVNNMIFHSDWSLVVWFGYALFISRLQLKWKYVDNYC